MRFTAATALVGLAAFRAAGQPGEIPSEVAFDAVKHAYRDAPYAERSVIVVRRPAATREPGDRPAERREEVVLRIDPGRGLNQTGARVYLELGELRVAAGDGRITVVHLRDPDNFVQLEYPGPLTPEALAAALPPLPLPQLDLSLGDKDPPTRLTAYAEAIAWQSAGVDDQAVPRIVTISGQSAGRPVELLTDAAGRLREFRVDLPQPAPAPAPPQPAAPSPAPTTPPAPAATPQLRIQAAREPLGNEPVWTISTEGRTRVPTLSQLRPKP